MTLTNRFIMCGELQEARIDLFRTHMKIKFSVSVNHQVITVSQTISRKWARDKYEEVMAAMSQIHPRIDGVVYADGLGEYYILKKTNIPSRLLISGNIMPWRGFIYYNMMFFRLVTNKKDSLSIELEGQWINKKEFINVVSDSPRLFNINIPKETKENQIYKLLLSYNPECKISDSIVFSLDAQDKLTIQSIEERDKKIEEDMMEKLMLEYEIMNSVYGGKE